MANSQLLIIANYIHIIQFNLEHTNIILFKALANRMKKREPCKRHAIHLLIYEHISREVILILITTIKISSYSCVVNSN